MREIKFRAWHDGEIDGRNKVIFKPQMLYDENPGDCLVWSRHQNIKNIMQYTGLKDCKGVEIYEGDIIGGIYDCFVKWCDDCKSFNLFALWDKSLCMQCDGNITWLEFVQDCEKVVIGNIHDTPELLEAAK